jgi:hypothetical protein
MALKNPYLYNFFYKTMRAACSNQTKSWSRRFSTDPALMAIRHMIDCLDCGYILWQYMSNKHYLLYKTRTSGLRWRRLLKKKKERKENFKNVHMFILPTHTRTVTCYKTDDAPQQTKPQLSFTTAKIWSSAPEWLNSKTYWLTDRQLQSNPDSEIHHGTIRNHFCLSQTIVLVHKLQ